MFKEVGKSCILFAGILDFECGTTGVITQGVKQH